MSYTYLQEQGEESSAESFSDIPQFVLSRLNLTADKSCCKDNETEFFQSSQYGMMYAHLTEDPGGERSISSAEASHVLTSALLGEGRESKENSQDFGPRCQGSFARFNPLSVSSWKTRQHSLFGGLEEFYGTWPQWGMMLNGECWVLTSPVSTTEENAFGLLPTPIATDWKGGTTSKRKDNGKERLDEWRHFVKARYGMTYPHPTHSEVRMGFPEGWSEPKPLEMHRFLKWQHQHGRF